MKLFNVKGVWPKTSDWFLALGSVRNTFLVFPKILFWNWAWIILIIFLGVMEYQKTSFQTGFSILCWFFSLFVVPMQLYNWQHRGIKPLLKFKSFVSRTFFHVVWELIKEFFKSIGYVLLLIGYLLGLAFFVAYIQNVWIVILAGIALFPLIFFVMLRLFQFIFIPYIVFFNKIYMEKKERPLKLSEEVSQGLFIVSLVLTFIWKVLGVGIYIFFYKTLIQLLKIKFNDENKDWWDWIDRIMKVDKLEKEVFEFQWAFTALDSFLSLAIAIITVSVVYFMYIEKDKENLI